MRSEQANRVMDQLREQDRRLEKLSKLEHDLIKEVHPQVGEIREGMAETIAAVKKNNEASRRQKGGPDFLKF